MILPVLLKHRNNLPKLCGALSLAQMWWHQTEITSDQGVVFRSIMDSFRVCHCMFVYVCTLLHENMATTISVLCQRVAFSAELKVFSLFPQNGEVDPAVKALEARQDEIMRKLYELKAAVEGLAKTVTTPDADLDLTVSSSLSPQSLSSTTFSGSMDLDSLLGKVRWWISPSAHTCLIASSSKRCVTWHNLLVMEFALRRM